jgi:hypothetical protein
MVDFIRGNRDWAKTISEQILNLSSSDKQRLVEATVCDRIPVSLAVEENGAEHWDIDPIISFNINILQALSEEGGLGSIYPR